MNSSANASERTKNVRRRFRAGSACLFIVTSFACGQVALAAGDITLEEVVVTARKRAENSQDVPIAITTVSEARIKEYGANEMSELIAHVPNFDWDPVGLDSLSSWGLRGIVDTSRNAGQESGLGFYVDGVSIGRPVGFNASLADIDHIEVLRGPQGSLYGRNTIAGAVNITTKRPTNDLAIDLDANFGNFQRLDGEASVSGPLIHDVLLGKVSAFEQSNSGYIRNLAAGASSLMNEDRHGGRAALYWRPADDLEVRFAGDFMHENHRTAFGLADDPQLSAAVPQWYFTNRYTTNQNDPDFELIDVGGGSVTVNWTLAGYELTSISAERVNNFDLQNDDDAGPITLTHSHFIDKSSVFSQELRLSSPGGGLYDYVVGLYYMDEHVSSNRHTPVVSLAEDPTESIGIFDRGKVRTRSSALFGNINYHFLPTWTLGVGLRFTDDKKNAGFTQTVNVPALGFPPVVAFPDAKRDDKQVSGDVTVNWKPREGLLGYVTVRRGFKSGGFQTDIIDFTAPAQFNFKPETATTYEIGAKTEALQRHLRLNAAVFDTEYKDMQVSQLVGLGFSTSNAGKSRIKGAELEIDYLPIEHLTLGINGGVLDARYQQFPNCGSTGTLLDCSGNRLQFTPNWNVGTTLDYRQPVPGGAVTFHADSSSRGYEYSDALNSDGARVLADGTTSWPLRIGGYTLIGARLGFETAAKNWGVYLWGKNLTDKFYNLRRWRYPITPLAFGAATGAQGIEFLPSQPRTWGLEITYKY